MISHLRSWGSHSLALAIAVAFVLLSISPSSAQLPPRKKVRIQISGSANAEGSLVWHVVERGAACDAAGAEGAEVFYDNLDKGYTTATEIRNVTVSALQMALPPIYAIEVVDFDGIHEFEITAKADFDVCVDGVKIIPPSSPGNPRVENGLTITGQAKVKGLDNVPMTGAVGLTILSVALAGTAVAMLRKKQPGFWA